MLNGLITGMARDFGHTSQGLWGILVITRADSLSRCLLVVAGSVFCPEYAGFNNARAQQACAVENPGIKSNGVITVFNGKIHHIDHVHWRAGFTPNVV